MNYTELQGDESGISEWLLENSSASQKIVSENLSKPSKFIIYPMLKCGCARPVISYTNDGNKKQWCDNCKWSWNAPK